MPIGLSVDGAVEDIDDLDMEMEEVDEAQRALWPVAELVSVENSGEEIEGANVTTWRSSGMGQRFDASLARGSGKSSDKRSGRRDFSTSAKARSVHQPEGGVAVHGECYGEGE